MGIMNIRFNTKKVISVKILLAQFTPVCLIAVADDLISCSPCRHIPAYDP